MQVVSRVPPGVRALKVLSLQPLPRSPLPGSPRGAGSSRGTWSAVAAMRGRADRRDSAAEAQRPAQAAPLYIEATGADCSPPGLSVHGIFQARVLEWVAIAFSDRPTK